MENSKHFRIFVILFIVFLATLIMGIVLAILNLDAIKAYIPTLIEEFKSSVGSSQANAITG